MTVRKPTDLKRLQGTYRPDRDSANGPNPGTAGISMPRGVLPASARRAWRAWGPELERLGLLTGLDLPLFMLTCLWAGLAADAARLLREDGIITRDGSGREAKNRAVSVLRVASSELRQLAGRFGLTPADRASLHLSVEEGEEDFADLLVRMATEGGGDGTN
jgi:P27 family predicted phage terminase small subunit